MSELYSGRVWCAWCHDNVSLVDGHGKSLRIEQYYEIDVILSMKHLDIYIMNRANNIYTQFFDSFDWPSFLESSCGRFERLVFHCVCLREIIFAEYSEGLGSKGEVPLYHFASSPQSAKSRKSSTKSEGTENCCIQPCSSSF